MEENTQPNNKQPQFPGPSTEPPKRVVRTYQSDLARINKEGGTEFGKKEESKKEVREKKKEKPKQKQEGLVTPPKREEVAFEKQEVPKETQKHYVEEIQSTDSIDISSSQSFTQKDVDDAVRSSESREKRETPNPAPQPKPEPMAPPRPAPQPKPLKEQAVVIEESSQPQQNIFASIMAWLLGGSGETKPVKETVKEKKPLVPPKALQGIPVVPKVIKQEEPSPEPVEAPKPPEPPEVPEPPASESPQPVEVEPPLPPKPVEVPEPPKPAPQPETKLPTGGAVDRSPLFAPPKERVEATPPKPSVPPTSPKELTEPSPISTYTSDARKGIKERKHTPLSVLAKQQDSKKAPPKPQGVERKSNTKIIAVGATLLTLGVGAVAGVFLFLNAEPEPVTQAPRVVTPIFAENRASVSANTTPAISDLGDLLSSVPAPAPNTLTHITFSTPTETGSEVVSFSEILLASKVVPGAFARTVYPQSMLGVFGTEKEPVLVLAVSSFERSFKGLLSWENSMPEDLEPIFGELVTAPVSTSTPPYVPTFVDETIETTDARILYDAHGNPHIIYGYITPNILFITKTRDTFIDLTGRIVRE